MVSSYAPFRLLVLDADPHAGTALAQKLALMGYGVQLSTSGRQAIQLLEQMCFDVLVIDPSLPDIAGQAVLEEARRHSPDMVIIVLASRADLESALVAIKCAVNGYLCKSPQLSGTVRELMHTLDAQMPRIRRHANIRVLQEAMAHWHALEASQKVSAEITAVCCADRVTYLELDQERRVIRLRRKDVVCEKALTPKETALLQALMTRPGCVLSWDQLAMVACPAIGRDRAYSLVRRYIGHLRRKIELDPTCSRVIRTVRGKGYLLDATPAPLPSVAS